ncbi:MAG TPA: energy-coupling factor ABC transporter permease [Polyangiaceae bacterium]|nr:energy-coupling factor ABC transporter permease [Polyangiaceae bacterium]
MRSRPWRWGADFAHDAELNSPFYFSAIVAVSALLVPGDASAMHLADGVLPAKWCAVWAVLALPFIVVAFRRFERRRRDDAFSTPFTAMIGAAVFALSCMPIPVPVVGTCSHPCGTGLAGILLGPSATVLLTVVALTIQALFLAHGGLTTFGADVLSMGIAGGFIGHAAFRAARSVGWSLGPAAFLAGLLADWATYATTALELALGLHGERSAYGVFGAVALAFAPTQLPLGILEGFLTAGAIVFVHERRPDLLLRLRAASTRAA